MLKNISSVKGIKIWGSHVGIKSKRRDLAIIYSEKQANAAAVFTKNLVAAEPVKVSRENIKDGKAQAFVINAGNANACTGKQGYEGALAMMKSASENLNIKPEDVIIASTGIIGEKFPTKKVVDGIKEAVPHLTSRQVAGSLAANAILTTDTFAKEGFIDFELQGKEINIGGIAKGSGMIHPNMGTMLGFIVSDVAISSEMLDKALKDVVEKTFNMINVDGDTSTNDMVGIMCNGEAGNKEITTADNDYEKFKEKLEDLCMHLAKLIVSDGEGSTKFIEYEVVNAKTEKEARQIVKTISDSKLVQTAMFGKDPNWGRILAAAGRSGVKFNPDKVDLYIGTFKNKLQILEEGQPVSHNRSSLKKQMRDSHLKVLLDLNYGNRSAKGWGTDISYEYVRINAEYTT